jgi:hypothetical protein
MRSVREDRESRELERLIAQAIPIPRCGATRCDNVARRALRRRGDGAIRAAVSICYA